MTRVLLLVFLGALLLFPTAAGAGATNVVVSQIYGGGGNAGATFRNDYVELFNTGSATVDLSGWTVQYATAAGTSWQTTALSGSIAPGRYYLVQLASTADVGAALPPADATGTSNLAATSGKVALVRGTAALTCGASAGSCSPDQLVEDLVGYGDASDFEGAGSAAGLSSTLAALRANDGCTDLGNNATDFAAGLPAPRNSASPAHSCGATPSPGPGSVNVDLDVASVLSVSLDHPSISFGTLASGDRPTPLSERVTVSSNNTAGYSLVVARTAFAPGDLPLAVAATAPAGGTLGGAFAGGALVPIPITPAAGLTIGTKSASSAAGGDVWATSIGFSSPLPLVATGRYTSTVTFTAIAR
jgi:lamin tail-like protein